MIDKLSIMDKLWAKNKYKCFKEDLNDNSYG